MRNLLPGLMAACVLAAATPALAEGYQVVVGFDDRPIGTENFSFKAFGDAAFTNSIFGGTITTATLADPAVSGTQVYVGTAIGFRLSDPFNYSWPAVGAFVTGSAPITLTLRGYDYAQGAEVVVSTTGLPGGTLKTYLGVGDEVEPGYFTSALFESTEAFSIDDLTLGLVNVGPGIPEPGTWALLVIGFGLVGGAMRKSRQPDMLSGTKPTLRTA